MPTQTTQLLKNIQTALAASPGLATQLSVCESKDELAAQLTKALSFPVSAADLTALEQQSKADMTDEQLEAVTGGTTFGLVLSFASSGIGCAIASVVAEIHDKSCKKRLAKEF